MNQKVNRMWAHKLLASMLAVLLVLTMMPGRAFAEAGQPLQGSAESGAVAEESQDNVARQEADPKADAPSVATIEAPVATEAQSAGTGEAAAFSSFSTGAIQEQSDQMSPQAGGTIKVIIDLEGYNLGQGFYIEPTQIELDEGSTAQDATMALFNLYADSGYEGKGIDTGYLNAVRGPNVSDSDDVTYPEYLDPYSGDFGDTDGNGWLNEFDYSTTAGWMFTVNHALSEKGMAELVLNDGDVIRWQFSVFGLGVDLGFPSRWDPDLPECYAHADKTALYRTLFSTAYAPSQDAIDFALGIIIDPLASDGDVAEAVSALKGGSVAVDKTALDTLIAEVSSLVESEYTVESWAPFATALTEAASVSADGSASQEAVDGACAALSAARGALVKKQSDFVVGADGTLTSYVGAGGAVYIPDSVDGISVTKIGASVFQNVAITNVSIPAAVTEIGMMAFAYRASLASVEFRGSEATPNQLGSIGMYAFMATGTTEIVLPENLTSIGMAAFGGCKALRKVTALNKGVDLNADVFFGSVLSFILYGYTGSTAEAFATANSGITFIALGDEAVDPTPTVALSDAEGNAIPAGGYEYAAGEQNVTALKASASSSDESLTYIYEWRSKTSENVSYSSAAPGERASQTYIPATSTDGLKYYFCRVTYEIDGVRHSVDSDLVAIKVVATSAQAPSIADQPASADYLVGSPDVAALRVAATRTDGGTLSYQWFKGNAAEGFEALGGARSSSYTPAVLDAVGSTQYYCIVTNTVRSSSGDVYTAQTQSETATISFKNAADLGMTWQGSGSASDPFQLGNQEDLVLLSAKVDQGFSFKEKHFLMTGAVELPLEWAPIGTSVTRFSGSFDGGGNLLTVPAGGQPLFGSVRGANIGNLAVFGERIENYGLVSGYSVDSPGEVATIENVTLKAGSSTLYSGFIGGYASGENNITIRNSTIEEGVVIGYSKDKSGIGSFAGEFNGTIEDCVSYATVYGVNAVGGIVGAKGQAMGLCNIDDSAFHGSVVASGDYVGGMAGKGYSDYTAPNTPCVSVRNCLVTGSISGADSVGGIIGGETVVQTWDNGAGYIQNNLFVGSVSASGSKVGGIIGSLNSLNRYNVIANNYFADSCGAAKGIGGIATVDTSHAAPMSVDGVAYFNTEKELPGISGVDKRNHNRTDDPLGADASALTRAVTSTELADGTIAGLLNAGESSSGSWQQGADYPGFDLIAQPVDRAALAALITQAKEFEEGGYTAASWVVFASALAEAEAVYGNEDAKQEAVDAAAGALERAIGLLKAVVVPVVELPTAEEVSAILDRTASFQKSMIPSGGLTFGSDGDWTAIGLARGGHMADNVKSAYLKNVADYVIGADGKLSSTKLTEYSRIIIALTSLGIDATDFAGYDLTAPLASFEQVKKQGINGPAFALIALDTGNYTMPTLEADSADTQATRQMFIDEILRRELPAGGWNLLGYGSADPDVTGMVLQALAPYAGDQKVSSAIDHALTKLSNVQEGDGGFASSGVSCAESCFQVIVALNTLGISLDDTRFVKNGNTLYDGLMQYFDEATGGWKHMAGDAAPNGLATYQAGYALASLYRSLTGAESLYDMTSLSLKGYKADADTGKDDGDDGDDGDGDGGDDGDDGDGDGDGDDNQNGGTSVTNNTTNNTTANTDNNTNNNTTSNNTVRNYYGASTVTGSGSGTGGSQSGTSNDGAADKGASAGATASSNSTPTAKQSTASAVLDDESNPLASSDEAGGFSPRTIAGIAAAVLALALAGWLVSRLVSRGRKTEEVGTVAAEAS